MTTGLHATWRMLCAFKKLGDARVEVEYEDRRSGKITPAMQRQLDRLKVIQA